MMRKYELTGRDGILIVNGRMPHATSMTNCFSQGLLTVGDQTTL
jgi:hypothetical protein